MNSLKGPKSHTLPRRVSHVSAALWFNAICCTHLPLCWQGVIIDFLWSLWKEVLLPWWWLQRGRWPCSHSNANPALLHFHQGHKNSEASKKHPLGVLSPCRQAGSSFLFPQAHCGRTEQKGPATKRHWLRMDKKVGCPPPYRRRL